MSRQILSSNSSKILCAFNIQENHTFTPKELQLYERQEGLCYICSDELDLKTQDIIKTPCDHLYHYDCLYYTMIGNLYNPRKKHNIRQIRECPYCRTFIKSHMPIFKLNNYQLKKYIHYEHVFICQAILKSGKKKGMSCGCTTKSAVFCGRHKNSKMFEYSSDTGLFIS